MESCAHVVARADGGGVVGGQRRKIERIAARSSVSVGAVVRAGIDALVPTASAPLATSEQRRRALDDLFALEAPVAGWPVMEAETEAGYHR
jgi:hypothetical protein